MRDLLADVGGLARSVGFRIPEGELTCVVGIGARRLGAAVRPPASGRAASVPRARRRTRHGAPATPGDLLFHIRAHRLDLCFELAAQLMRPARRTRRGGRRGARVPVVRRARPARLRRRHREPGAAPRRATPRSIGDEDPAFAGGSYVDRPEVPARPRRLGRAAGRGAGARDRPHEARATSSCPTSVKPAELARRAQHDRRRRRRRAADRPRATCRSAASAPASSAPTSSATRATPT